ncbi:MAG: hypothetical protein MUC92_13060 [Fimbriimonadaceae bacterium]|nr:hypothetical protein [Fimbriimonadaceae bacterium]
MKNQNDIILCIVAFVFAVGLSAVFFFNKKQPQQLPEPAKVITTPATVSAGAVVFANSLPNAGSAAGGAGPSSGATGRGGFAGAPSGPPAGAGAPGGRGGRPSAAQVGM